jgi:hypothetical protein
MLCSYRQEVFWKWKTEKYGNVMPTNVVNYVNKQYNDNF